jgi:hypothetical protein
LRIKGLKKQAGGRRKILVFGKSEFYHKRAKGAKIFLKKCGNNSKEESKFNFLI